MEQNMYSTAGEDRPRYSKRSIAAGVSGVVAIVILIGVVLTQPAPEDTPGLLTEQEQVEIGMRIVGVTADDVTLSPEERQEIAARISTTSAAATTAALAPEERAAIEARINNSEQQ